MFKKITAVVLSALLICLTFQSVFAGQPGTTGIVFNRRFNQKLRPMMPYVQLVKMIGAEGAKTGEDKSTSPPKATYHWDGGRKSALDVTVVAGKVVDASLISPKGKRFLLDTTRDRSE